MPKIRWIHFSDLHLNKENIDTRLLRKQLKNYLIERNIQCDYAFCSGDLRNAPDKVFPENSVQQLKEICDAVDVPLEHFFLVPGNHDVDRDCPERMEAVKRVLYNRGEKKEEKGYYNTDEGKIEEADLLEIKKGQEDFIQVMEELYRDIPERAAAYREPTHFLVKTEDLNVVHLDSTITYSKGQEESLVIGTDLLMNVLD